MFESLVTSALISLSLSLSQERRKRRKKEDQTQKREVKAVTKKVYTGVDKEFRDENSVTLMQYRTSQASFESGMGEGLVDSSQHGSSTGHSDKPGHSGYPPTQPALVEVSKPVAPPPSPPIDKKPYQDMVQGSPHVSFSLSLSLSLSLS